MWKVKEIMNQVVDEISDDLTEEAIKTTSTAKKFCMTETYNSVKKNIK